MPKSLTKKAARTNRPLRRAPSSGRPGSRAENAAAGAPVPAAVDSDSLRVDYLPLLALKRAPRNPKDHDLGALSQSFQRFGFVSPVVMDDRTGQLVAGHGRLDGLLQRQRAGEPPPKGIRADEHGAWHVPVVRGWASQSDVDAEAYLLADNQMTIAGGWIDAELLMLMRDLDKDAEGLAGTGFDRDDLNELLRRVEGPTFPPASEDEQGRLDKGSPITCPSCGHEWTKQ